ncbi:MAG: pseudouridine synthase, partial [Victivallaceae bacterium]
MQPANRKVKIMPSNQNITPDSPQNSCESPNLTKFLALHAGLSRRAAADKIKQGGVVLNGQPCSNPATRILPTDRVVLDGKKVTPKGEKFYFLLNKPRGFVCTNSDPFAENKAVDLINVGSEIRLYSAGRLDKASEGAIIFSNDGDFTAKLTHPKFGIEKEYLVSADQSLSDSELTKIRHGIMDDGDLLQVLLIEPVGERKYRIRLNEGKNREIRRLLAAVNCRTKRLQRVSIGNLKLGNLPVGS